MRSTFKMSFIAIALLFTTTSLNAAEAKFSIFILKGDCMSKQKGSAKLVKLKNGGAISSGEYISVEKSSYIAIRHTSGRTAEIFGPGLFSADSIEKKVMGKKDELFKKYVAFVISSSSNDISSFTKEENKSKTSVAGTSRSFSFKKNNINLINPRNSLLIDYTVSFCWNKTDDADEYILHINDATNQPIYKQAVKDTSIMVDLTKMHLKIETFYNWTVTAKTKDGEHRSSASFLFISDTAKIHSVKDTSEALIKNLKLSTSPLDNAIIANFYERNNVYYKAYEHYRKAVDLSGNIPEFKILFDAFQNKIDKMSE